MQTAVITIQFSDADWQAYSALPAGSERTAFTVAKIAAQIAPQLLQSLAKGNVLAALCPADQAAINSLIAAIKAVPNG